MFREFRPCLPTRVPVPPSGRNWIHEAKHDGFRIIARRIGSVIRLQTKQGYDWARRYTLVVDAIRNLKVRSVVLDGEVMCFTKGREDFDKLWNQLHDHEAVLCAFDLLELNGEDLRGLPLRERKARLARLLRKSRAGLHLVEYMEGDGPTIFEHACRLGLEGIVSKRADLPYRAGVSRTWLKTKNKKHPALLRVKEAFEEERKRELLRS
jgi:ATP-dependent DNA ligase